MWGKQIGTIMGMETRIVYHNEPLPEALEEVFSCEELLRLDDVGMHCGCEYTSFPIFKGLSKYSRAQHSYGVAAIIYHFTHDLAQSLSGAFHDISTPCFSHVIDFLHGDNQKQEYTEGLTEEMIASSKGIQSILSKLGISLEAVSDYHIYPIADNDTPKLSADRLEYSLSNIINFGFATKQEAQELYDDLCVSTNEYGETELCFQSAEKGVRFAKLVLKTSKVYVCPEDRYSMHMLALLLKQAVECGAIEEHDLYQTESSLIEKLSIQPRFAELFARFRALDNYTIAPEGTKGSVKIPAKLRHIDPSVKGMGRVSEIDPSFKAELAEFLSEDFAACFLIDPSF